MISFRQAQNQIEEHEENLGSPTVSIDPEYQARIQKAVDIVNQKEPGLLSNITDIIGRLSDGPFGRFSTNNPHTIYVNIQKLESELRSRLSGQPEETIQQELDNQIVKTIIHEATHQHEFSERGYSSESGPDQAEEKANEFLPPIEVKAEYRHLITVKADLLKQLKGKEDEIVGKLEVVLEAHKSEDYPDRPYPRERKVVPVGSMTEASKVVTKWIDDNQLGASNVGESIILYNGSPVARVSYNGKVWNMDGQAYSTKTAAFIVTAYVRKMGDKWCVLSHKGKKLGCYGSKSRAQKRLRQIEYFKHH